MSEKAIRETGRLAKATAVALCWRHWLTLGAPAVPDARGSSGSMVDPEALILLSLRVSDEERRLRDLVAWWARTGSRLTSVQRMSTLAAGFPEAAPPNGHRTFAYLAAEGGDRRWKRSAGDAPAWQVRTTKGSERLSLADPGALWLRLRAGLGVGAKADIVAYLLGRQGAWASAKSIAFATGYSTVAVRDAVGDMVLARLIQEMDGRPSEYRAPTTPWAALLGFAEDRAGPQGGAGIPIWSYWAQVSAFLADAMAWSDGWESGAGPSIRVWASRARDVMEAHEPALRLNRINVPRPDDFRGTELVEGLLHTVRGVSDWVGEVG